VVHEPTFGSDETAQKFLTAVSGGIVPDLLGNESSYIPGYAEIDALTDLGPFMDSSETVKPESFPPGVLSLCTYDGKVWGIPVYADTMVLYYNKTLLEEAGFDPESPPSDWSTFREAAIAMTKRDASGKLLVSGCGLGGWSGPRIFMPWLYAWGGQMYNDDMTKAAFNGPEGKEVLNNIVDLIYKDRVTEFGWGEEFEDSVNEPFIAETMAMTFDVPAATRRIVRWRPEFQNWGITGLPAGAEGFAQIADACALMIPKAAKHPEEAWRVIEYWMQPKVMVRWAKDIFRPPSTLSAMEDEGVMEDPRIAPVTEVLQYTVELPQTAKYGEIFNALSAEIELAMVGDKSADQALDDAAGAVDLILARS
jgi:multiple sugar transport system substrate-binding protein